MPAAWIADLRWHYRQHRWDCLCAAVLFLGGMLAGGIYTATWGGQPSFHQAFTGPAVMAACGHGFANPKLPESAELEAFLHGTRESLPCNLLPENPSLLPRDYRSLGPAELQAWHPDTQFPEAIGWQETHRYLLYAMALCWRILGIAWSSLLPLHALLYGLSCAAAFAICRMAVPAPFAFLGGLLLLSSPFHLQMLPHLAEYSKAPFILVSILFMGIAVRCEPTWKRCLALGLAAGLWMGIGLGVHPAMAPCIVLFAVIALTLSPGLFYHTAALRLLLAASFAVGVAAAAWPVAIPRYQENTLGRDALLGLSQGHEERLGLRAPLYSFAGPANDALARACLEAALPGGSSSDTTPAFTPEYHRAIQASLRPVLETFPADLVLRGAAAMLRSADEFQAAGTPPLPQHISNAFLVRLFHWRDVAVGALPGVGRYTIAAALLLIAAHNMQMAMAAALISLVIAAYPAIRFEPLRAFHTEIVTVFSIVFLLSWCWASANWLRVRWHYRSLPSPLPWKAPALRMAALAGICVLLPLFSLLTLRYIQDGRVDVLLSHYESAPRSPLTYNVEALPGGRQRLTIPYFTSPEAIPGDRSAQQDYLVLQIAANAPSENLNLVYGAGTVRSELDHFIRIHETGHQDGAALVFIPVVHTRQEPFAGLEVSLEFAEAITGIWRADNPRTLQPFLVVTLGPAWKNRLRHAGLSR